MNWRWLLLTFVLSDLSTTAAAQDLFTIAVTGEVKGYLEPCGCSVDLLGGLPRRMTQLRQLGSQHVPLLVLDNGDLSAGYSDQDRIKLRYLLSAMKMMNYALINPGENDHLWGEVFEEEVESSGLDFVTTSNRLRSWTMAGHSIVLIAANEDSLPGIEFPQAARNAFRILLHHGKRKDARLWAQNASLKPNLVISGHHQEDPEEPLSIDEIVYANYGSKGKYLLSVNVSASGPGKYDSRPVLIALDQNIEDDAGIVQLLKDYDAELKEQKLVLRFANRHRLKRGTRYRGAEKCQACHREAYLVWSSSGHRRAYATLERQDKEFDPECVFCHTVGYGSISGFSRVGRQPDLRGVGCENCHGAGHEHIANPMAAEMSSDLKTCAHTCHVLDHSPNFVLDSYWGRIKH